MRWKFHNCWLFPVAWASTSSGKGPPQNLCLGHPNSWIHPWASEGGQVGPRPSLDFENFGKKGCFLSFEWKKPDFITVDPLEKFWKNPPRPRPEKSPYDAHGSCGIQVTAKYNLFLNQASNVGSIAKANEEFWHHLTAWDSKHHGKLCFCIWCCSLVFFHLQTFLSWSEQLSNWSLCNNNAKASWPTSSGC